MVEPKTFAVRWRDGACYLLDQTRLPSEVDYTRCETFEPIVEAITKLAVRGAPAIGIAGAFAVALAARQAETSSTPEVFFEGACKLIRDARPTAVNLAWAVERVLSHWKGNPTQFSELRSHAYLEEAQRIHTEDILANRRMAEFGLELIEPGSSVITYCNTGDLATGGIGTAFGVLHAAYRAGRVKHVYTCETRPVLQGLRLTAWELQSNGIPFTVLCDNMAAQLMRRERIGAVIVGSDRIVSNGDIANKVGTYSLAVLAKHHGVPFLVAAPTSTFDMKLKSGDEIPIEERSAAEIYSVLGTNTYSPAPKVMNPSFDVTPANLISAIICERGVASPPTQDSVAALMRGV